MSNNVKIKELKSRFGYTIDSIQFVQNGDCYVNINIGTFTTSKAEGKEENKFQQMFQKNYHIPSVDMNQLMADLAEPVPLRDVVEYVLEQYLIGIGQLGE